MIEFLVVCVVAFGCIALLAMLGCIMAKGV